MSSPIDPEEKEAPFYDIAILGLGYVGLPLAQLACQVGYRVLGIDSDASLVHRLNAGQSHIQDIDNRGLRSMLEAGMTVSQNAAMLRYAETIVVCVPTPLGSDNNPDLKSLRAAGHSVASNLRAGHLVIVESTSYPGSTEEIIGTELAASGLRVGMDYYLAFSPERIDPGNRSYTLRNTPKIVGGVEPRSTKKAAQFYRGLVDEVREVSSARVAELAKLIENSQRLINVSLANEFAMIAHDLKIDIWEALWAASTKPFGYTPYSPGPGVGGHCIPIDPHYLRFAAQRVGSDSHLIKASAQINERMPRYVAERALALSQPDENFLLVGVSFKSGISDTRESPAIQITRTLRANGREVSYYDDLVPSFHVDGRPVQKNSTLTTTSPSGVGILLQSQASDVKRLVVGSTRVILDTRGVLRGPNVERL